MSKRNEQHLSVKLENILNLLVKLITHPELLNIKVKFPLPTKEQGTGLYTFDTSSQFYQGLVIDTKKAGSSRKDMSNKGLVSIK
jgi:hypothetical protein